MNLRKESGEISENKEDQPENHNPSIGGLESKGE